MDDTKFRTSFPEFRDPEKYPKGTIDFWAELGEELIGRVKWGRKYEKGLFLFVAHNLTLARQNAQTSAAGGAPGKPQGNITSKKVGAVAVSYDSSNIGNPKDGIWGQTTYGQLYAQLLRIVGAGCIQL